MSGQAPYYLRVKVNEFKAVEFYRYAVGIGGIPLCDEKVSEWECTVVFNTGVVKYYQGRNADVTYWVIEVFGNIHGTLSVLQDFINGVRTASVEPMNNCGDCYCR